jgi:hypothetical protein
MSPSATPSIDAWAEVRAHELVMRYRRAGASGRPVVVVGAEAPDACWPELAERLASHFRLILPEVPGDADPATWLARFLEGLGVQAVGMVALDRGVVPAVELALLDGERVGRLVLVPRGRAEETGLDGSLSVAGRDGRIPLLVVRRALPAAEAVPLILDFLAGATSDRPS